MPPVVRLDRGVLVELDEGPSIRLDGAGPADATVMSHAHADHLVRNGPVVAAELTVELAAVRRDRRVERTDHPAVELVDAGHVPGSRAARITDPSTGETVLYTGDCCTRDRFFIDGFDPPPADVLVIEATYGRPTYRLPPTDAVVADVHAWLEATADRVAVLSAYALGRAQVLEHLLRDSVRDRVFVTADVAACNAPIERALGVDFAVDRLSDGVDLHPGDAVVAPAGALRRGHTAAALARVETTTAAASGWATEAAFVHRRGVDAGFALSDHCDFDELLGVVEAVDPEVVYTHHGFADDLAAAVTRRLGVPAWALKRAQTRLGEY
ncbi:MAG: mRNA 3'-end processing factor [Halobacteriales archaeon]